MTPGARTVRLDLAYDGTDFAGWQDQPAQRTVQGVVERVLTRLQAGRPARVRGASRTDAGVHASGQVADCRLDLPQSDEHLAYALRRMLPRDVRATRVRTTEAAFHARHDATSKEYHYLLDLTRHGDPLEARYALHCPFELDRVALGRALQLLPGRRDWSGFTGAACEVTDRVRDLQEARFEAWGDERVRFVFAADGFLQHMVRNLVGTLLEVARGRMPVERIEDILASRDRRLAGPTAAARGLCLRRVVYDSDRCPAS